MTTLFKEPETCLVCGQSYDYVGIGSTNRFGSADLDTRPPEMMRSTMPFWIRRCPSCGYCAPRVSEGPELVKSVVRAERYVRQRDDPAFPELASSFLCWAIVQEELGDLPGAGWAALHAAWACDDQGTPEAARQCRERAIALFRQARAKGAPFAEGRGDEQALLADLLRRSGQFEQVAAVCQEGLQANPSQTIRDVLAFQKALALRKDDRRHRIEEAVKQAPPDLVGGKPRPKRGRFAADPDWEDVEKRYRGQRSRNRRFVSESGLSSRLLCPYICRAFRGSFRVFRGPPVRDGP